MISSHCPIRFSCPKMTDKCLKEFGYYLSQGFKSLQNLSIQFYQFFFFEVSASLISLWKMRRSKWYWLPNLHNRYQPYFRSSWKTKSRIHFVNITTGMNNSHFIRSGISFKTVEFLGIELNSNTKNLKELTFRYSGYQIFSSNILSLLNREFGTQDAEALESLKQTLDFVPHLNIYKL